MIEIKKIFPESNLIKNSNIKLKGIKIFKTKNVALISLSTNDNDKDLIDDIKSLFSDELTNMKIEIEVDDIDDEDVLQDILIKQLREKYFLKDFEFKL